MKLRALVLLSILGLTSARDRRRRAQGPSKGKGYNPPPPVPVTKSPTASPTKSPTASPTKSPTASPTMAPSPAPFSVDCTNAADTDGYEFELMWLPGQMRPCAWLCWNPAKTEERKDRYCGKKDIAQNCSITCGICAPPTPPPTMGPTKSPTMSPTEEPTAVPSTEPSVMPTAVPSTEPSAIPSVGPTPAPTPCGDSSTFTFELMNSPGEFRGCDWITFNRFQIEFRQKKYCYKTDVAAACPFACELCPGQTPFTSSPTKTPTASPTKSPTPAPSAAPIVCVDDTSYTFEMINFPGQMQDCKWICWRESKIAIRRANYCGNAATAAACPVSCGLCTP